VLEAVVVDVDESGAMVPLLTVPESAEPLAHDASRTLAAMTAVTAIHFLMGPWFH
jgi:hypothetical protein